MQKMRKIIISGMLGNGLEWYDFAVYAYMALTIKTLFFPEGNEEAHLLFTYGIYAVGFVARPFGGVLFGMIGDKLGRRTALMTSIFMMAVPTAMIGLLPTYAQAGIAAPLLLTLCRLLQGLSLGGAFSGSIAFLVEHSPPKHRGLIGSATISSLAIGFLIGALVSITLKTYVSMEAFNEWGWRVPFLLGLPIGFIGFYIRHNCEESPAYTAAKAEGTLSATPVRDALSHELKHILQAIGIYTTVTMPFYMVSAYFITFTERTLGRSKEEALLLNMGIMIILLLGAPLSAMLSDRIGRRKVLALGAVVFFCATMPLFDLLQSQNFTHIMLAQLAFGAMVALYTGPVPTLLVEIFPTRVRYSCMALSYNISAATFGGTAPMVCEWLISRTGSAYSVAYYVMTCSAVSLLSLLFYKERFREDLR